MSFLIFGIFAGFWIVGFILMIDGLLHVPEGYEDERGFHYATRPSKPQPSFHVMLHHGGV